jgi:hypothetical protein
VLIPDDSQPGVVASAHALRVNGGVHADRQVLVDAIAVVKRSGNNAALKAAHS